MTFEPKPGMSLDLNGEIIQFTALESSGPAAVFVYAEAGKEGTIYRVLKGGEHYALKVFFPDYQDKRLVKNTQRLKQFRHLKGFRVAERMVINRRSFPEVVDEFPELNYSVLMPWIQGTIWGNLMLDGHPLRREQYFQIAQSLLDAVAGLEAEGLAHCDLSNNNFIINPTFTSIELIDIEDMYAPDMPRPMPDISYGSIGYRTNWIAEKGLWGPKSDRFACAILCCEILTWHNAGIRKNRAGNASFFDEDEIGGQCERFQIMKDCLSQASDDLPMLFERAWFSEEFDQCPPVEDWRQAVEKSSESIQKPSERIELPEGQNPSKKRANPSRRTNQAKARVFPAKIEISHSILDFDTISNSHFALELSISNTGGSALTGHISTISWMNVSPRRFSIGPGETRIVTVSLKRDLPTPEVGFEYRTPNALVIESNVGEEVIGARFKLANSSISTLWIGGLVVGLVGLIISGVSRFKITSPADLLIPLILGFIGILAGWLAKRFQNFRSYQTILKALGMNAFVILLSFAIPFSYFSYYQESNLVNKLVSNSIFLTLLMMVFAPALKRDSGELEKSPVKAAHPKENRRAISRPGSRHPVENSGIKAKPKRTIKKTFSGSAYVFVDDGTPLYESLPASNNWSVWLEKGAELSITEPLEKAMSALRKYGYYIEVVDAKGNRGFVTATAVKIKFS